MPRPPAEKVCPNCLLPVGTPQAEKCECPICTLCRWPIGLCECIGRFATAGYGSVEFEETGPLTVLEHSGIIVRVHYEHPRGGLLSIPRNSRMFVAIELSETCNTSCRVPSKGENRREGHMVEAARAADQWRARIHALDGTLRSEFLETLRTVKPGPRQGPSYEALAKSRNATLWNQAILVNTAYERMDWKVYRNREASMLELLMECGFDYEDSARIMGTMLRTLNRGEAPRENWPVTKDRMRTPLRSGARQAHQTTGEMWKALEDRRWGLTTNVVTPEEG